MINITINQSESRTEILLEGHAISRVCAAVSILSQTLVQSVLELTNDRIVYKIPPLGDTSGITKILFPDGMGHYAEILYNNFFVGIHSLSVSYPDDVSYIVIND